MSLLDRFHVKRLLILCHHNADPDAICSAFAFSSLLKRLRPNLQIEVAAAQGPSRLSKELLKVLPIELTSNPHIEEADLIALLDTNTIQQLDGWGERVKEAGAPIIVIDHHASHPETERLATLCILNEEASSPCEIIYQLFKEAGLRPNQQEAKAIFLGIAFDTRHFVLAKSTTLKVLAELVDAGVKVEETLSLLSLPMDESERIARIKACQRAVLTRIEGWIVVLSHVSAYQASAARALIGLGAHVAVVAGQKGDKLQVSIRACSEFHKRTGIHLGRDIAKPLGEYLHGMGGGHSVSAGVNGVGDIQTCFDYCIRLLKERLRGTTEPSSHNASTPTAFP